MVNVADDNFISMKSDLNNWQETIAWLQDDIGSDPEPKSFKYAFDKIMIDRDTEEGCKETSKELDKKSMTDIRQMLRIVRSNQRA